jgi:DNA repair protein RecN (Recombination protein N)
VEEITAANIQPGEDEELVSERMRLANSKRLSTLSEQVYALLIESGDDDTFAVRERGGARSVRDLLGDASSMLLELSRLDPSMEGRMAQVDAVYESVEELGRTMRVYRESVEHDPSRLEDLEERISLLHELKRKYGPNLDEVIEFGQRAAAELEGIQNSEERIAALAEEAERLAAEIGELGAQMHTVRREAGDRLADAVEAAMKDLLMGSARFKVDISQTAQNDGVPIPGKEGKWAYSEKGVDRVEFLIAPNLGEPLKPLVKIASGGETSRIMLALKSILSLADQTPTLVFDEVDVGVGGRSGNVVGEKLWGLTRTHQVVCITHLPQIAAFADTHFKISKTVSGDRTRTQVDELSAREQEQEIAVMLGGAPASPAALANAKEMLKEIGKVKEERGLVAREA